jgi:hypothetical protein
MLYRTAAGHLPAAVLFSHNGLDEFLTMGGWSRIIKFFVQITFKFNAFFIGYNKRMI